MTNSHATVLVVDDQVRHAGLAAILKGILRTVGTAARQKAPATVDVIHALIARLHLIGRNRLHAASVVSVTRYFVGPPRSDLRFEIAALIPEHEFEGNWKGSRAIEFSFS
ncbi:hypothetical protein [Ensifer sp. LCM 4579]|uniref:hypothetical protein n=1 Tax=Ensifer sp. LCM 4579 TaxID=1848292 RepID=UPI0008D9B8B0|nr:hypothetical protein [Ensifer sp. LCM 4579]OHV80095.1 hypothetical protein LCM4579_23215 [Ensifer sp. LCM 4579]